MAKEGLFTLLNSPTPQEIRKSIGRVDDKQALQVAQLAPGRGQVYQANRAGGAFSRAFSKPTAAEKRAAKLQKANAQMSALYEAGKVDPTDSVSALEKYADILGKAGLTAEAAELMGKAEAQKIERGELETKKAKAQADASDPKSKVGGILYDYRAELAKENPDPVAIAVHKQDLRNAIEDEDSRVTTIQGIFDMERERYDKIYGSMKKGDPRWRPFNMQRFTPFNRSLIAEIQTLPGTKRIVNEALADVSTGQQLQTDSYGNPLKSAEPEKPKVVETPKATTSEPSDPRYQAFKERVKAQFPDATDAQILENYKKRTASPKKEKKAKPEAPSGPVFPDTPSGRRAKVVWEISVKKNLKKVKKAASDVTKLQNFSKDELEQALQYGEFDKWDRYRIEGAIQSKE